METNRQDSRVTGWLRLGGCVILLGILMFGLAPLPIEHFAPMAHYVHQAEKNDIHPGALYYSDVSVTPEAITNSRNTVRFYYDMPRQEDR